MSGDWRSGKRSGAAKTPSPLFIYLFSMSPIVAELRNAGWTFHCCPSLVAMLAVFSIEPEDHAGLSVRRCRSGSSPDHQR